MLYPKVEKHDLAVQHAEKAVEIEPEDTFNWTALSTTYQKAFEATRDRQYIFRAKTPSSARPKCSGSGKHSSCPSSGSFVCGFIMGPNFRLGDQLDLILMSCGYGPTACVFFRVGQRLELELVISDLIAQRPPAGRSPTSEHSVTFRTPPELAGLLRDRHRSSSPPLAIPMASAFMIAASSPAA